jgi:hypothetical protein
MRRAYFHGIIKQDSKKLLYENHVGYGESKVGAIFGVRALLDKVTCQKYIN